MSLGRSAKFSLVNAKWFVLSYYSLAHNYSYYSIVNVVLASIVGSYTFIV